MPCCVLFRSFVRSFARLVVVSICMCKCTQGRIATTNCIHILCTFAFALFILLFIFSFAFSFSLTSLGRLSSNLFAITTTTSSTLSSGETVERRCLQLCPFLCSCLFVFYIRLIRSLSYFCGGDGGTKDTFGSRKYHPHNEQQHLALLQAISSSSDSVCTEKSDPYLEIATNDNRRRHSLTTTTASSGDVSPLSPLSPSSLSPLSPRRARVVITLSSASYQHHLESSSHDSTRSDQKEIKKQKDDHVNTIAYSTLV